MKWIDYLSNQLNIQKKRKLWRKRKIIQNNNIRTLLIDNKKYLNFSTNDYLGLTSNQSIIEAWKTGLDKFGTGSGSSSYITGYSSAHAKLETKLANWLNYDKALLFNSGYSANQSVINVLMNHKNNLIIADKLFHASLLEAGINSKAKLKRFNHNEILSLEKKILESNSKKILVATEGIFSMNGDIAPLNQIQIITKKYNTFLLVDDAHGIGIQGKEGSGSCKLYNIKPELLIVTFGKAFGISGAALLCNKTIANYFLQNAKHLIYSTSIPPAQAMALIEAINQIRHADKLRMNLKKNISFFIKKAHEYNLPILNSYTPIQPLMVGKNDVCLKIAEFLKKNKIWVQAIRPPTVPPGTSRLRITLNACHKLNDILKLIKTISYFFKKINE
ncbi:MAG: 8-amino-7-oxononanoate synthase [Arsenophonus sp.]|nr:MAG: 8-amino-7-oxononanoate synthase [Arsenophonus sp.]